MKLQLYERLKNLAEPTDSSTITAAQAALLTGGDSTTLHFHAEDRKRANHTGTQPASSISDLDAIIRSSVATIASNHAVLANLAWSVSGHTGTASNLAGFSGTGAAAYYSLGTGVATFLATPSSANLAAAVTDETGSGGALVFASGPTLTGTVNLADMVTSGNVGLGITAIVQNASSRVLHIHGGANGSEVRLTNTATGSTANNGSIFEIVGSDTYLYNFENASLILGTNSTDRLTITGTGAATFANTLAVTGDFAVNGTKFTVAASSGNTVVAGTLGATGDFSVASTKFTVAASSGNTVVAGSLNVTGSATFGSAGFGAVTLTDLTTTGNTILGDASTDTLNVGNGDIRKDASGNVGFGVAAVRQNASARTLQIDGGANGAELRFTNNATGSTANNGSILEIVGSDCYLFNFEAAKLFFGTNATEAMQIDSSQNVGVGMTPARKLDVTGTFGATGAVTLGSTLNLTGAGTFSSTLDVTGAVTGSSFADSKGDVRTIVQNSKSAAYTTVLADAGKHIFHPSTDATARIWTIDSNANVAYPVGTAITFVNEGGAGAITIAITSDTLYWAGTGGTGSRTLAAAGVATALKIASTKWIISGTNLS